LNVASSPGSSTAPRTARRLRILAALASVGVAAQAQALGLGEARVISGLNAPLVAEIAVVDATPAELAALRAEIPGRDVFMRYGLDWPGFLATASVTLRTSSAGTPVLVVRTEQAVSEPFLTLLVAANWGRGRVLREFNLVVDRPSETAEPLTPMEVQAPAVQPGRSGTVDRASEPAPEPAPEPASAPAPERETRSPARPSGDSVTVRSGDSLSRIAATVARRQGVTTSQALVGIYEANREAFGASMNDLRAGAVLRIPDAAELAALPPQRVTAEVNRAVSQWRGRSGASTQVADATGRLRLVAPSEISVGLGGDTRAAEPPVAKRADPPKASEGPSATTNPTATAGETVDQRLARIEQQLLEKQRLLEVTSAQLADLQAAAAAAPQAGQTGLVTTLQAMFGKVWWLWGMLLLTVLALVGMLLGVRRRAAAAEAELQAWAQAPRQEWSTPASAPSPTTVEVAPAPATPVAAAASAPATVDPDDLEGDPPTIEEAGSKIDLARAFIEMGEQAAARAELEDVLRIGNVSQRQEAQRLLDSLR
jgi:pilus assembly protein FimV